MELQPDDAADVAAEANPHLACYRAEPSLSRLLRVTEILCTAKDRRAAAGAAGISEEWLRTQGEITARMTVPEVRDAKRGAVLSLRALRLALADLGVSCSGWAVSDEEIADSLLRHTWAVYRRAVARLSPADGWEVLRLQAEDGCVPSLEALAPGAAAVVTGYAVRHALDELAAGDPDASLVLSQLRRMLPALEPGVREEFRRAGIPADKESLAHAELVRDVHGFWENCSSGEAIRSAVLTLACRILLAQKTVRPEEIGTTTEAVWAQARGWVTRQVQQIEDGDPHAFSVLSYFAHSSELGLQPFGISDAQASRWETEHIRACWKQAQSGDGGAAFAVMCHCEDEGNDYEHITSLPADQARDRLQAIMDEYASGLKTQVETAAHHMWARTPFHELVAFATVVRQVNQNAVSRDGRPIAGTPWEMSPTGWHELRDRYVRRRTRQQPPLSWRPKPAQD